MLLLTSSCAIMPPIETPARFSDRGSVHSTKSSSSSTSLAISDVE